MSKNSRVNPEYRYSEGNIDSYVYNIIRYRFGGFKSDEHKFLLRDKHGAVKNPYYVLYSGAIDSTGRIPLDFFFDKTKQPAPDPGRKDDRKDVFDELMPVMLLEKDCKAKILFPFNITNIHWLTGEIVIDKKGYNVSVIIYTHNPYGGGQSSENNFSILNAALKKKIEERRLNVTSVSNQISPFTNARQSQKDSTSCGVITADEIVKRITDSSLTITSPHPVGAEQLRLSQLTFLQDNLGEEDRDYQLFKEQITTFSSQNNSIESSPTHNSQKIFNVTTPLVKQRNQQQSSAQISHKKITVETNTLVEPSSEEVAQKVKEYSKNKEKLIKPSEGSDSGINSSKFYEDKIRTLRKSVIEGQVLSEDSIEHLVKYTEIGLGTKVIDGLGNVLVPVQRIANKICKATAWGELGVTIPIMSMQALAYAIEDERQYELVIKVHKEIMEGHNDRIKLKNNISLTSQFLQLQNSPIQNTAAIALCHLKTINNDLPLNVVEKLKELIALPCTVYKSYIDDDHYSTPLETDFKELRFRAMKGISHAAGNKFKFPDELYSLIKTTLGKVEDNQEFFLPKKSQAVQNKLGEKTHLSWYQKSLTNILPVQLTALQILDDKVKRKELLSEQDFNYLYENLSSRDKVKIKALRTLLMTAVINNQRNNEIHKKFIDILTKSLDDKNEKIAKLASLCLCHFDLEKSTVEMSKQIFLQKGLQILDRILLPIEHKRYTKLKEAKEIVQYRDLAIYSLARFTENNPNIIKEKGLFKTFEKVFEEIKIEAAYAVGSYLYNYASDLPIIEASLVENLKELQTCSNNKLVIAASCAILSILRNIDNYPELKSLVSLDNIEDKIYSSEPGLRLEYCQIFANYAQRGCISNKAVENLVKVIRQEDKNTSDLIKAKGFAIQGFAYAIKNFTEYKTKDLIVLQCLFIKDLFSFLKSETYREQVIFALLQVSKLISWEATIEHKTLKKSKENINSVFKENLLEYGNVLCSLLLKPSENSESLEYIIRTLNIIAKAELVLGSDITDLVVKAIILKDSPNIQSEAVKTLYNAAANPVEPDFSDITLDKLVSMFFSVDEQNQDNIRATLKHYLVKVETRKLPRDIITKLSWGLSSKGSSALNAARILEIAAQSKKANFSDEAVRKLIETISDSNDIELKIKLAETIIAFTKHNQVSAEDLREIENFFYHDNLQEHALKIIKNIIYLDEKCTEELSERFFAELSSIFEHYQSGNVDIKITMCRIFAKVPSKITPKNLQALTSALGTEPIVEVKHELVISLKSYIKYHIDCKEELANTELLGIAKVFCSTFTSTLPNPPFSENELAFAKALINAIYLLSIKYPNMLTPDTITKCADLLQECFDETVRQDAKEVLFNFSIIIDPTLPERVKETIFVEKKVNNFSSLKITKESIAELIAEVEKIGLFTINYLEVLSKETEGHFVQEALNGLLIATEKGKIVGINVINSLNKIMDANPKDVFHILSNISIRNGEILPTNVKKHIEQSLEAHKEDEVFLGLFVDLLTKNYIPNPSVIKIFLTLLNNSDFKIVKKSILGLSYIKHLIQKKELSLENIKLLIKKLEDLNYQEVTKSIINIIEIIPRIELDSAISALLERIIDIKAKEALFSSLAFNRQQILKDLKKYEGNILKSTFTILERSLIYEDDVLRRLALEVLKQAAVAKLEFPVPDIIVEEVCNILSGGNPCTQKLALEFLLELVRFNQTTSNILTISRLGKINILADSSEEIKNILELHWQKVSKAQQGILVPQKQYSSYFFLISFDFFSSVFLSIKEKGTKFLQELLTKFKKSGEQIQLTSDLFVNMLLSNTGSNVPSLNEQFKEYLSSLQQYNKYKEDDQKLCNLLSEIIKKQAKYNLEIMQVNQLLFFLQLGHERSMVLLSSKEQDKNIWFDTVINNWLIDRISNHLDIDEIKNNSKAVSSVVKFISKFPVKELVDVENILNSIFYQTVTSIEEFFDIIKQFNFPLNAISRLLESQVDGLKINELYDIIGKIILLEIPERVLTELSSSGWDIKVILRLNKAIIQKTGEGAETELLLILTTLYNYGIDFSYKNKILEIIEQNDKDDWIKVLNKFICSEVFQSDASELNTNELITTFSDYNLRGQTGRLAENFLEILIDEKIFKKGKLQSRFADELRNQQPIQSWQEKVILAWAELVKKNQDLAKSNDFLPEMLAVINRAVIQHNSVGDCEGYELRKAQVLSILSLLSKEEIGRLSQISTGEGKSVTISALAVINALRGEKIDIITSSPLLASRDAKHFKNFYAKFGLDCADNSDDYYSGAGPKLCYDNDIVYGNVSNFQFDILREEFSLLETKGGRRFECAIVDEVDSMLIDEGVNIAMLSSPVPGMNYLNLIFMTIWSNLPEEQKFTRGDKDVFISETKKEVLSQIDRKEIIVPKHLISFIKHKIELWIKTAIEAKYTYQLGVEYRIADEQIYPVDFANTGVTYQNSRWGDGLHQFLEIKHRLKLQQESLVTNYCTNIAYFKRYYNDQTKTNKLFGLTGTLGSERAQELLANLYKVDFVKVPRYKQRQFKVFPPKICDSEVNWINKVIDSVMLELSKGRAVLVICETEKDAEKIEGEISKVKLDRFKIMKYTTSDSEQSPVIEGIMNPGYVIIATNLAGRGTDIKISDEVKHNGGLHVCVTFLPTNIRVEEQAFGRTAREGKPGTAELIIIGNSTVEQLRKERDSIERKALDRYEKDDVPVNNIKQKLFEDFCKLRNELNEIDEIEKNKNMIANMATNLGNKIKYKLKALDEEWGLWLAQQENFDIEIYAKFEAFAKNSRINFTNDTIIKNPIYLLGYANDLITFLETWRGIGDNWGLWSKLNRNIMSALDEAIKLDEDLSFYAHYLTAYIKIKHSQTGVHLDPSAKKTQKAEIKKTLKSLEESKELIEDKEISQLYKLVELYKKCSLSNKEKDPRLPIDKQDELSKLYVHTVERLNILKNYVSNIDSNIKEIKDSRKLIDIIVDITESTVQPHEKKDKLAKIKSEKLQLTSFKEYSLSKSKKYLDKLPDTCKISLHFHNLREVRDMHFVELRGDAGEIISKAFSSNRDSNQQVVDIKFEKFIIAKAVRLLPQYRIDSIKAEKCSDKWPVVVQKMVNFGKGINEWRKEEQNRLENLCHKLHNAETIHVNLTFHDLPKNKYEKIVNKIEEQLTNEEKGKFDKKIEEPSTVLLEKISQTNAIKILNNLQAEEKQIKVDLSFTDIGDRQAEQIIYLNADYIKDAVILVKNLSKADALRVVTESKLSAETFERPRLDVCEKYLLPTTNREEILDLRNNELRYFFSLSEKSPFRVATFCTVATLAVIQGAIAAGLMSSGVGIPLAQHFIAETVADLFNLMAIANGTFDWSNYVALKIAAYTAFGVGELLTSSVSTTARIVEEISNVEETVAIGLQFTDNGFNAAKNVTTIGKNFTPKVVSNATKVLLNEVVSTATAVSTKAVATAITSVLEDVQEEMREEIKDIVEKDLSSFLEKNQALLESIFIKATLLPHEDVLKQLSEKLERLSACNSNKFIVEAEKILQDIDRKYNFRVMLETKLLEDKSRPLLEQINIKEEVIKITNFYLQCNCIDHCLNLNPNKVLPNLTDQTTIDKKAVEKATKDIHVEYSRDYSEQRLKFNKKIVWILVGNKQRKFEKSIGCVRTALNITCSGLTALTTSGIESLFPGNKELLDQNPSFVTHLKKLCNLKSVEDVNSTIIQLNQQYEIIKTGAMSIIKFAQGNPILPDKFAEALEQFRGIALKPNEQVVNTEDSNHSYITDMQSKAITLLEDILFHSDDILQQLADQNGNSSVRQIVLTVIFYCPSVITHASTGFFLIAQVQALDKSFIQQLINSDKLWNSLSRLDKYLPHCRQILITFKLFEEFIQEGGILDQDGLKLLSGVLSQPTMVEKLRPLLLNYFSEKPDWYGITSLAIDLGANNEPFKKYLVAKKVSLKHFLLSKYRDSISQQLEGYGLDNRVLDYIDTILNNIVSINAIFKSYNQNKKLEAVIKFIEFLTVETDFTNYVITTPKFISNICNSIECLKGVMKDVDIDRLSQIVIDNLPQISEVLKAFQAGQYCHCLWEASKLFIKIIPNVPSIIKSATVLVGNYVNFKVSQDKLSSKITLDQVDDLVPIGFTIEDID